MLLLHKSWCGACKKLKTEFQGSEEIVAMSKKFVMVNAEDNEDPHGSVTFQIDGSYIPRTYFLNPEGQILDVKSEHPKFKFFFGDAPSILGAMWAALSASPRG